MTEVHDAGTASDVKLTAGVTFGAKENCGPENGFAKLTGEKTASVSLYALI